LQPSCELSGKEKEVLAMENGGNKKVNAIWEAHLARAGGRKPTTGADLTTRERYIRDKYERRKYYDPNALVAYQDSEPSFDDIVPAGTGGSNAPAGYGDFGPPTDVQVSEAARLRAEKKKKKGDASRSKSSEGVPKAKPAARMKTTPAPAPEVDLLDLMGGGDSAPAPAPPTSNNGDFGDFFGATPATAAPAGGHALPARSRSKIKSSSGRSTKSKTPDRDTVRKTQQQDILSMYGNNPGGQVMPGQIVGGGMPNNMNMNANMMHMMQQMQQMTMNMTPQQQQQMAISMQNMQNNMGGTMMNPHQMQGGNSGGQPSKADARLAAHQNMMMMNMQSHMQQNQNMQQQMRSMQQQGQGGGTNMQHTNMVGMQNGGGGMPGMNPNMQMGMNPNMMMGVNPNMMMGMNPNMMQGGGQHLGGNPMGAAAPHMSQQNGNVSAKTAEAEKKDPFAQFGMNAFR